MNTTYARGVRAVLSVVCLILGGALLPGPGCGALAAAASGSDAELDQLLQLLAQRRHGHVIFTEVRKLAMLEGPLHSSGELLYEAPDRLEERILKPREEDLLLEHGVLTERRGHRTRVLSLREYPQAVPFVECVRATLAGDRAALERYFRVRFSGDLAQWTLDLTPSDTRVARTVQQIQIEGERDTIHTVEILERDGDTSVLTLGPDVGP